MGGTVTTAEAIRFFKSHQPMPPDKELSEELIAQYDEARRALELDPVPSSLPWLLRSFGEGSGFGVYQLVRDTLRAFQAEDVVQALADTLTSAVPSVRSWSMELALEYPDVRLVPHAIASLASPDRDTRFFAASYLVDLGWSSPSIKSALIEAAHDEEDPDVRDVLLEGPHTRR
jgi:hypothetical protein